MTAVGYDDFKQCFIVRNSWGEDWGDKGNLDLIDFLLIFVVFFLYLFLLVIPIHSLCPFLFLLDYLDFHGLQKHAKAICEDVELK